MNGAKLRNINIDLIKVLASFSVIGVHFFLNTGFYEEVISGPIGFMAVTLRTFFMMCVPLFIISTGYLMINKEPTKEYFFKIWRVLVPYFVCSCLCMLWRICVFDQSYSPYTFFRAIFDFTACSYSWYVEMYIGLYLLIPFINVVCSGISKQQYRWFLAVLLIICSVPSLFNFNDKLFPNWWAGALYPVLYYVGGGYLRKYGIPVHPGKALMFYIFALLVFSAGNYALCMLLDGGAFGWPVYTGWGSIENVTLSTLLFIAIMGLKTGGLNAHVRTIFVGLSKLTLYAYLLSWIADKTIYPIMLDHFRSFNDLFPIGMAVIPLNAAFAFIAGYVVSRIVDALIQWLGGACKRIA